MFVTSVLTRAALSLAFAIFSYSAVSAATLTFDLDDHPDGNRSPPYEYGLRLDSQPSSLANGERLFFSFNGASTARLYVNTVNNTARIKGTLIENSLNFPALSTWELDYTFSGVTANPDHSGAFISSGGSGELTQLTAVGGALLRSLSLTSKAKRGTNIAMEFSNELFRNFDGWNGRGWIQANGTNDFLFTATVVPLPAALPLFGGALALLGMMGWRRKRSG